MIYIKEEFCALKRSLDTATGPGPVKLTFMGFFCGLKKRPLPLYPALTGN
jgi:hypothetical protein